MVARLCCSASGFSDWVRDHRIESCSATVPRNTQTATLTRQARYWSALGQHQLTRPALYGNRVARIEGSTLRGYSKDVSISVTPVEADSPSKVNPARDKKKIDTISGPDDELRMATSSPVFSVTPSRNSTTMTQKTRRVGLLAQRLFSINRNAILRR